MCDKTNLYADTGIDYRTFRNFMTGMTNTDIAPDTFYNRALFSQAYHETGGFTSRIWKETKNAFGMRPAQSRHQFYCWTLNTGSGNYAGYNSHKDTIDDRLDLDRYNNINISLSTSEEVSNYMIEVKSKGYATDPNYVTSWFNVYLQLFPNVDGVAGTYDDYNSEETQGNDLPSFEFSGILKSPILLFGLMIFFIRYLLKRKKK